MRKIVVFATLFVLCIFYSDAYCVDLIRDDKIVEKEWSESKPLVFGYLTLPPPNDNNCNWENDGDLALNFDISILSRLAGSSFDVDDIYMDGVATGESALNFWLLTWKLNEGEYAIPPLNGYDWSNRDVISFCVGKMAQGLSGGANAFENIVLWYDGSVETVYHHSPVGDEDDSSQYSGSMVDMTKESGSKLVSSGQDSNDNESGTWSNEVSYTPPRDDSVSLGGDPDFKPMELYIDHHRKLLRPGQDHEVFVRIKNKGDANSPEDIQIRYWRSDGYKIDDEDDRDSFGTDVIQKENLPPGDSKWESKTNTAPSTPGIYNYTVEADDEDEIDEVKESNNTFDPPYVFEVKKPDLYFANAYIVGEQEQYSPGYAFQVKVFTENSGSNPGRDAQVYYYMDGVKFGEDNMREYNIEPEDPPKEESIYAVAPMNPGTHTVSAVIDPGGYVNEGSESNNTWSKTFTVVVPDPEPVYDTAVASVSVSNPELSFYPGEIFEISAVAQNLGDNPPSDILMGYFLLGGELSEPLLLGSITITSQDFPSTSIITKSLGNIGAPGLSGIYQIKACINYDERFVEASEENDCRTIEIEVKKEHLNPAVINILD